MQVASTSRSNEPSISLPTGTWTGSAAWRHRSMKAMTAWLSSASVDQPWAVARAARVSQLGRVAASGAAMTVSEASADSPSDGAAGGALAPSGADGGV